MTHSSVSTQVSIAIKRSALFLVISVATIWGLGVVFEKISLAVDTSYPQAVAAMSLQDEDYDVVFLGDSTVSQSVNPVAAFDGSTWSGYNLANPGANFVSMTGSLKHYLANNSRPKLIAIGVYVNKGDGDTGVSPNIFLGMSEENQAWIESTLRKHGDNTVDVKFRLLNSVTAYRLRDSIESLLKVLIQGRQRIPEFVNGHLALSVRLQSDASIPAPFPAGFKEAMLADLLIFCEEQELPVVLFEPPASPGFNAVVQGRQKVVAKLESLVESGKVLEFKSFNDSTTQPYETGEWVNANHFNQFGAERFSRQYLGPWIQTFDVE